MSDYTSPLTENTLDDFKSGEYILGEGEEHIPPSTEVEEFEQSRSDRLAHLIGDFAPHLAQSFVCQRSWWKKHQGVPEAHVRPHSTGRFPAGLSVLTISQMFKFMLYRALTTGMVIFNDGGAPLLSSSKEQVEKYNGLASVIWRDSGTFSDRQKRCEGLLGTVVPGLEQVNRRIHDDHLRQFPTSIEKDLNTIFHEHYDTSEKYLLFGRTDDEAYRVQDGYALAVAELLSSLDLRYGSKAHLCLRKMYGRGAPLPLLCESSVEAMWEVCKDSYYKGQISLVSSTCLTSWRPC
jgi:hypothetical protein